MITLHANGTIDGLAAGTIPAASISDVYSSDAFNIAGLRIQRGSFDTGTGTNSSTSTLGYSCVKYKDHVKTNIMSGFASAPMVTAELGSDYHEAKVCTVRDITTTGFKVMVTAARDAGIENRTIRWVAIGEAS